MAILEVPVPQLSESVAEATLLQWHKKVGEAVARDENLIDIETDKVVLELPAPAQGVIVEIIKADGSTVVAGEVIARIDTEATASAAAPAAAAVTPSAEAHLGADELAIAERVHKGHLSCELGASVRVEADASRPGYFDLQGKGFRYRMHPVATSTGAIRLEDKKAGAVWLQLANKSMLMDQNKGRRIADECANSEQVAFAQNMKNNPPPKLFDTTGMGRQD